MKKTLIMILIILLVIIIAIGSLLYIKLKPPKSDSNISDEKPGIICSTDEIFITNLKDSNKVLKSDILIEVKDEQSKNILKKYNYKVRDRIIYILGNITENNIKQEDFKNNLKKEIKNDLQNTLNIDTIINIYFNEFVVQ